MNHKNLTRAELQVSSLESHKFNGMTYMAEIDGLCIIYQNGRNLGCYLETSVSHLLHF